VVVPALIRLLAKKNYRFLYLGVTEAEAQKPDSKSLTA